MDTWIGKYNLFSLLILSAFLAFFIVGCGSNTAYPYTQSGNPLALLTLSDGPIYSFGTLMLGSTADKNFVVSNIGGTDATHMTGSFNLSQNYSYKDGFYPGTGGSCGTVLAFNSQCTVVVTFAPVYAGTLTDSVHISYYDGASNTITDNPQLTGIGQ